MSEFTLQNHKKDLRKKIRKDLHDMSPSQRSAEATRMNNALIDFLKLQPNGTLLAYAAFSIEPCIDPAISFALENGWRIALPLITDIPAGLMELHQIQSLDELIAGPMGIRQPAPSPDTRVSPDRIDIGLIPAWAYDRKSGVRLGKGGGFYDRLLAHPQWRARSFGIAFRCQLHDALPAEPHDMHVESIFTADGLVHPG